MCFCRVLKTESFRTYTVEDGIPSNEFNRYEFSRSDDGELYFGTMGGVFHFNPNTFSKKGEPSKVIINRLYLYNNPIEYLLTSANQESDKFNLSSPLPFCKQLTFSPGEEMITFGFAVMDLTAPSKNKFKYRLIGLHEDWVPSGMRNEATFTNLSPGNYLLEVLGCNSEEVWNEKPVQLNFTILAPWYSTWWFRLLVALFLASFLYGFYRLRLEQLLKVEKMRNLIAQDLHDEIGSTLSSISLYSAVMQRSADKIPKNVNEILGKIIDSTSEIMEGMNDMVWTIKADNDSFEHVIYRMRAFAGKMCEAKGIILLFNAEPKAEKLKLGMNMRKNIYLIFKEAVNNAVKYSECEQLSVTIRQENKLIIQISDNGIGFDPDNYNHANELLGGNGLRGIQSRAKEIGAHITIESKSNQGCIITLRMPT
ncbi:MAG: triple tyrosine motif-containing protein [Bacteroidia bacterium]